LCFDRLNLSMGRMTSMSRQRAKQHCLTAGDRSRDGAGFDVVNADAGADRLTGSGNGVAVEPYDLIIGDLSEIDEALSFDFATVLSLI
jgi:hypothetical protein